jgi:hypothetical protein
MRENGMNTFESFGLSKKPTCVICGARDIRVDYFDGDIPLELGECPRCSHRWTRSMLMPERTRAGVSATVRLLEAPNLPRAA